MRRETCLYCEESGKTTALVPVGNWGCCPIHSSDYLAQVSRPTATVAQLVRLSGIDIHATGKGSPGVSRGESE